MLVQVCNACGQVGYVPENYVQFLCTQQEGARQPDSIISMTPPNGIEAGTSSRGQCDKRFASITQMDLFQLRLRSSSQVLRSRRCDTCLEQLFVTHKVALLSVIGHQLLCWYAGI